MNNSDYQKIVEEKNGKDLKSVMYELCVIKDVIAAEGASILGVPKSTFITWRNKFRYGPYQRQADLAERINKRNKESFEEQTANVDLNRELKYTDEKSLTGFKEIVERLVELKKAQYLIEDNTDISIMFEISILEGTLNNIEKYLNGELLGIFNNHKRV